MRGLQVNSLNLMILGGLLLVIGAVLPFLMMTQTIESTFVLNFVSAIASLLGLVIGLYGLFEYHRASKKGRGG